MLAIAKTKLEPSRLLQWDISTSEIPSILLGKSFDFIISTYTLHHFDRSTKLEILSNYKSILNDTGKMVIADISFDSYDHLSEVKKGAISSWDTAEEQGYFISSEFINDVKESGLTVEYIKVSFCSAIYLIH